MTDHSFRHAIASSQATLPAAALLALLGWMGHGWGEPNRWYGLAATLVTAYAIAEWNNRGQLIRIRSRMASSTFLVVMAAMPFLHSWSAEMLVPIAYVGSFILLFQSYQLPRPEGYVFHAFLLLGLGSFLMPLLLFTVPFFYLSMLIQLRLLTLRTFMASLLGLALPYWCYAGYAIWKAQLDTAFLFLSDFVNTAPPEFGQVGNDRLISAAVLIFFALTATTCYLRTSYRDKIRTRMFIYCIIVQEVALTLLLATQPQAFDNLLRLFAAVSAPVIGHYFALAEGRIMKWWLLVFLAVLVSLFIFNENQSQWMPSPIFS
ncbi:MAG: hypothetical protein J6I32_05170 [Bacteroidaceae bacterium]|nr:hypothetical protein [Bacteroidaceae bacterium]